MKLSSNKVFMVTVLLSVMYQSIMTEHINETSPVELSLKKDIVEIETKMEPIEKKFEVLNTELEGTEENYNTQKLFSKDINQNNDYSFDIDQDLNDVKEIFLEIGDWIWSKLDDELKTKVQSKLKDNNLAIDSLWKDFSYDEIQKLTNAILETTSPFLQPVIEKISAMIPKNIRNLQEFFTFPQKDEL